MERLRRQHRTVKEPQTTPAAERQRAGCSKDLRQWLLTYLPDAFTMPFSADHDRVIGKLQGAIHNGGQFAQAMPRGSGKTTICKGSILYAILEGYRSYVVAIASDKAAAIDIIDFCKAQLRFNVKIHRAYPAICCYIIHSEGKSVKASSQLTTAGQPSHLRWIAEKIALPITVAGCPGDGAVIVAKGLTGGIRGLNHSRPDGQVVRPDFALLDDPQTRESAESPTQCNAREKITKGDVLGLAGPGQSITTVATLTIIERGDYADRLLDRKKSPEWMGETTQLVHKWPQAQKTLWADYAELLNADPDDRRKCQQKATAFYRANRKRMDRGSRVAWPERYDKKRGELSALQHAQNLLLEHGETAFWAEYQNDPRQSSDGMQYAIDTGLVSSRCNGRKRFQIFDSDVLCTFFCDINYSGLHWALVAWQPNMTGHCISYGKHPAGKNRVLYSPKRDSETTAAAAIYVGLADLMQQLKSLNLHRDGDPVVPDMVLIDCGAKWMDTVFDFCKANRRQLPFRLMPSRGFGGTKYRPSNAIARPGDSWHISDFRGKGRVLCHNADKWRAVAQKAFLLPPGAPGSFSFFGQNPLEHQEIAEHVCAEKLTDYVETDEGVYYKWVMSPGTHNDWLDAIVGCWVAASACGISATLGEARKAARGQRARQAKKRRVHHVAV